MKRTVKTEDITKLKLNPEDVVEEVVQNVSVLLNTYKGSVPQHRDFGISADLLHKPTNVAKAMLIADISDALEQYEPRAKVEGISFSFDSTDSSKVNITVEVEINE